MPRGEQCLGSLVLGCWWVAMAGNVEVAGALGWGRRWRSAVATTYNNMANVYYAQGDYARALELYGKALAIYIAALGEAHPSVGGHQPHIGAEGNRWCISMVGHGAFCCTFLWANPSAPRVCFPRPLGLRTRENQSSGE